MRTFYSILTGVSLLAAVAVPVQAETRVGVVNVVQLMEEAPQAKAAQSRLETEFAPREKELVALQKEVRKMEDRLSRDGSVMSDSESSKLEREILTKRRELKRSQDEFRDDLNIRKNEILSKLQRQVNEAIVSLAKEQKFDVILGQGVLYTSDKVNITGLMLDKLTKEFKSGGAK